MTSDDWETIAHGLACYEYVRDLDEEQKALARLRARMEALEGVATDWLNVMDFDGYDCTCETADTCPRCRCVAALHTDEGADE